MPTKKGATARPKSAAPQPTPKRPGAGAERPGGGVKPPRPKPPRPIAGGPPPRPNEDGGDFVEPPIITQGGGSVETNIPPKFKDKGPGPKGKKFKVDEYDLIDVIIDGGDPIPLRRDSTVTIRYGVRADGGSGKTGLKK